MQFSTQTVLGLVTALAFMGVVLGCPEGTGCFRSPPMCDPDTCALLVAWKANDADGIDFQLQAFNNLTDPRWVAVGFSIDGDMGEDDIMLCRQSSMDSSVVVEHYWSFISDTMVPGIVKETPKETSTLAEDGITNEMGTFENGYIRCTFTRAISVENKPRVYDLSEEKAPDMLPKYYYFFGTGPVYGEMPLQHEDDPYHTDAGVNYTVTGDVPVEEGSSSESHEDGEAAFVTYSMVLLLAMTTLAAIFN